MKRRFLIALLFIVSFSIFISGCGKECPLDCAPQDDCHTIKCDDTTDYSCKQVTIPKCTCGDNVCDEKIENKCTCPKDCGTCTQPQSTYLSASCDKKARLNDECNFAINKTQIKIKSYSKDIIQDGFTLKDDYDFRSIVDKRTDKLSWEITLTSKDENIIPGSIEITSIEVRGPGSLLYGRTIYKDNEKVFNKLNDRIRLDVALNKFNMDKPDDTITPSITIYYKASKRMISEYDANSNPIYTLNEVIGNWPESFDDPLVVVDSYYGLDKEPTKECPETCSDNNDCTLDTCGSDTNFECVNTPIPDCSCGDNYCDITKENRCNCIKDCSACPKDLISIYVTSKCDKFAKYGSECSVIINPVKVKIKPFSEDVAFDGFTLKVEESSKTPFDVNLDKITYDLTLITNEDSFVPPITLKTVELKSGILLLGRVSYTPPKTLNNKGDKIRIEVPINQYRLKNIEERFLPTVILYYTYSKNIQEGETYRTEFYSSPTYDLRVNEELIAINTQLSQAR